MLGVDGLLDMIDVVFSDVEDVDDRAFPCALAEGVAEQYGLYGFKVLEGLWGIVFVDDVDEGYKGILAEIVLRCFLSDGLCDVIAVFVPEVLPEVDPSLLFVGRADERGDIGVSSEQPCLFQAVEERCDACSLAESLIPGFSFGDDIDVCGIVDACGSLQL